MVLRVATGVPARFLTKGTLFRNAIGRLVMEAFGSIPVSIERTNPASAAATLVAEQRQLRALPGGAGGGGRPGAVSRRGCTPTPSSGR